MNSKYPNYDPKIRDRFIRCFQDRGMLKWGGFYLSDHTRVIEKTANYRAEKQSRYLKKQMNFQQISEILFKAFSNNREVEIQLADENREHGIAETIVGSVEGYDQKGIIIAKKNFSLDSIWRCDLV
ncbi:DNA polymerase III subunit alpha [Oenococcus sp. UCMA 16435]|nr:DNA polymerase III subunit alpha [Oenococcus sp. UCMA 16435]MDI4584202.1 DNA polymerase III subunit alpha [Oenococcus sp. UCMA 14587]